MDTKFVPAGLEAADYRSGLIIRRPRFAPEREGLMSVEYPIIWRSEILTLSLPGKEILPRGAGGSFEKHISLGSPDAVRYVLWIKARIGSPEEDFAFLKALATGLVAVYESGQQVYEKCLYFITAPKKTFDTLDVMIPDDECLLPNGEYLLHEKLIAPRHAQVATNDNALGSEAL